MGILGVGGVAFLIPVGLDLCFTMFGGGGGSADELLAEPEVTSLLAYSLASALALWFFEAIPLVTTLEGCFLNSMWTMELFFSTQ